MNNRGGAMTSLLTVGAVGAVLYGVRRGMQNGTFQRWQQSISNAMTSPQAQQLTQPLKNMANNQGNQQLTTELQSGAYNNQQQ
jgi:hypothetical protein